jgi:multidrug resistance protein MdtO
MAATAAAAPVVARPAVRAQATKEEQGFLSWFGSFLAGELKPYPGRYTVVWRMVISATLTMLIIMVFRIPSGAIATFNTLFVSRQSPRETLRSAWQILLWSLGGGVYCLLGVRLFIGYPATHFLWVLLSIFLSFLAVKRVPTTGGAPFASAVMLSIPLWDGPIPAEGLVTTTMWIAGGVSIGLVVTVLVEYMFSMFGESDELLSGLSDRLRAVSALLFALAEGRDATAEVKEVQRLSLVGGSRLRLLASNRSTGGNIDEDARRTTVISVVGRLVDVTAGMLETKPEFGAVERDCFRKLAQETEQLRAEVLGGEGSISVVPMAAPAQEASPIVTELERVIDFLAMVLSPEWRSEEQLMPPTPMAKRRNFYPGQSSPDDISFALRGCLAASICYVVMDAVAWRGLSTALVTCVLTALSSVGTSRQRQLLRLAGVVIGGGLIGMGAQILVLPMLDSISGFLALFVCVTWVACWFATSSPRLSYFGLQLALGFYFVHVQEFGPQVSLIPARDRVMGSLFGLMTMWLVFDTLGSSSAAQVMRKTFARNLQLLADLAKPWREGLSADVARVRKLRDEISTNFAQVNAQGDAIVFEVGRARARNLAMREQLLDLQPRLRSVFLVEVALLQYRGTIKPGEFDEAVRQAVHEFDDHASAALHRMGQHFSGRGSGRVSAESLLPYLRRVEEALEKEPHPNAERTRVLLVLFSRLRELVDSLQADVFGGAIPGVEVQAIATQVSV